MLDVKGWADQVIHSEKVLATQALQPEFNLGLSVDGEN